MSTHPENLSFSEKRAFGSTGLATEAEIEVCCIEEADSTIFFVRDNGVGFDWLYRLGFDWPMSTSCSLPFSECIVKPSSMALASIWHWCSE